MGGGKATDRSTSCAKFLNERSNEAFKRIFKESKGSYGQISYEKMKIFDEIVETEIAISEYNAEMGGQLNHEPDYS